MFKLNHISTKIIEQMNHESKRDEGYFETFLFIFFYTDVSILIGDKYLPCPPGTVILYEPNAPQYWKHSTRLNHSFFDFAVDDKKYMDEFKIPYNTPLFPQMQARSSELLENIKNCFNNLEYLSDKIIDSLLITLFIELSKKIQKKTTTSRQFTNSLREQFEEKRCIMYETPEDFDGVSYCKLLGFSPSRSLYYYKTFFDISINKDINSARKQKVTRIITKETKLSELASSLGFASDVYLSRWFHKEFGVTFNEYKNSLETI